MAAITVNIPNADVADALAAIESTWAKDATRLFFAGVRADYDAANASQRAKACLAAFIAVTTKNYRREQAERAVPPATEPVIT